MKRARDPIAVTVVGEPSPDALDLLVRHLRRRMPDVVSSRPRLKLITTPVANDAENSRPVPQKQQGSR